MHQKSSTGSQCHSDWSRRQQWSGHRKSCYPIASQTLTCFDREEFCYEFIFLLPTLCLHRAFVKYLLHPPIGHKNVLLLKMWHLVGNTHGSMVDFEGRRQVFHNVQIRRITNKIDNLNQYLASFFFFFFLSR